MKKVCLLALLCLAVGQLKAQKAIVFKVKYLPNHEYKMAVSMGMKIDATLKGDQSLIDKLNAEGITQPVSVNFQFGMHADTKTGAVSSDNMIPLNMEVRVDSLSVIANGKQAPIPPNISEKSAKIVGRAGLDGLSMMIDSVAGKKTNDSTQKNMKQMMSLFQKQIKFPEKGLKPGESFTQTMPLNIPIGKDSTNKIHMDYSITYKLISVAGGKAYFDVVPNFSMNFAIKTMNISMSGTGLGKMIYSIKDNFPLSNNGNFNLDIKVTSDKLNVDGKAVVTTNSNTMIN
ncbi:hypothetical protein [Mucilaginibacter ginsenosidivorans]|uniref:Uncharacterized protein n=1 Tax=Mucilaginibacter ginsenosidivorans TaxID=398053 RepID=A0A5B8UTB4_9SPHI|nr:hypothetical protein [Mucilaginibacter ginsenosidivorans]QEC61696.1 hypothetical protein FRZ54_03555 [Mucilaginibacter ginsenosidivorans]